MKPPPSATEPRSFADALADIHFLQQRVATASRVLLRKYGWRHTSLTPAHVWLWSRKLPDGRTILTDLNTALAIESSLAAQPAGRTPEASVKALPNSRLAVAAA
jgi:hypothetical protein